VAGQAGPHVKIFGIGLSRTGTLTLAKALTILGLDAQHFPDDPGTQEELKAGRYDLSILREKQALTDIPVAPFYAQFDALFPDSKFILTTRPTDSWLRSVENHFEMWVNQRRTPFDDFVHAWRLRDASFQREPIRVRQAVARRERSPLFRRQTRPAARVRHVQRRRVGDALPVPRPASARRAVPPRKPRANDAREPTGCRRAAPGTKSAFAASLGKWARLDSNQGPTDYEF
jgi:Sulfotransferase domain